MLVTNDSVGLDKEVKITPDTDGITHINIYSKGKTGLGKGLSHFAYTPFTHPYFGTFKCMEGLWFYLRNGQHLLSPEKQDGNYRTLSGFDVKKYGRDFERHIYPDFQEDILAANYQKIIQSSQLQCWITESTLPFTHYYAFNGYVVHPKESEWLCIGFDDIRTALQKDQVPECWLKAEKRYFNKSN